MNVKDIIAKLKGLKAIQRFLPPSLKEALSEDGVGSYSRYSGFMVICASILWVSFLIVKTHSIPDMGGVTEFITAGNSAYAANQLKRIAAANKTGVPNAASGPTPDPQGGDPNASAS
jgi:hypothetical protein